MASGRLNDFGVVVDFEPIDQVRVYDIATLVGYVPDDQCRASAFGVIIGYKLPVAARPQLQGSSLRERLDMQGAWTTRRRRKIQRG